MNMYSSRPTYIFGGLDMQNTAITGVSSITTTSLVAALSDNKLYLRSSGDTNHFL